MEGTARLVKKDRNPLGGETLRMLAGIVVSPSGRGAAGLLAGDCRVFVYHGPKKFLGAGVATAGPGQGVSGLWRV